MELRKRRILGIGSRSFRFAIDSDGLAVRHRGVDRQLPWPDIDALLLEQPPLRRESSYRPDPPILLLVPAPGAAAGLPITTYSPLDARPAARLLSLDEVRESPDEVAAALARHGGKRFTDVRTLRRSRVPVPEFAFGLRGYDPLGVDRLIREIQESLFHDGPEAARAALEKISNARIATALRGYDRGQVDELLRSLSQRLTADDDRWGPSGGSTG